MNDFTRLPHATYVAHRPSQGHTTRDMAYVSHIAARRDCGEALCPLHARASGWSEQPFAFFYCDARNGITIHERLKISCTTHCIHATRDALQPTASDAERGKRCNMHCADTGERATHRSHRPRQASHLGEGRSNNTSRLGRVEAKT